MITVAISVLTPAVIAGLKYAIKGLPVTLLPWLAPVIGMVAALLAQTAGLGELPYGLAALAGSAGVGIREALDQAKKALA